MKPIPWHILLVMSQVWAAAASVSSGWNAMFSALLGIAFLVLAVLSAIDRRNDV